MTVFWLVVAMFIAGALLFVLPPLLSPPVPAPHAAGDVNRAVLGDQRREARADAEAGLLDAAGLARLDRETLRREAEDAAGPAVALQPAPARRTAFAVALLLPAGVVALYLHLGRPHSVEPRLRAAEAIGPGARPSAADRHEIGSGELEQRVAALVERLKADPSQLDGWVMLGRSYTALGRWRDAISAFRRAVELQPRDASLLADLADLIGMAQGKRLAGEPARYVQAALDVDPRHPKALALAGSIAFEARDYAQARGHWQRLLDVLPADSPMARSVRGSLQQVALLEAGEAAGSAPGASAAAAVAPARIEGQVELGPELAARVAAGDTLYVSARSATGPRMPRAVQRRTLDAVAPARWSFVLDDGSAITPQLRLSGAESVVVSARISRSGSATPAPGDLVGESAPLSPRGAAARGLVLRVDRVQP
ncbi:MAG: c-type cytochrome biogenesis protein CcmI [Rubrivivax sp.]|nr:c-type cytochrome biogenesis protein CcmI [Rubrivivax sp.]